jgi:hypothetical protein
MPRALAFVGVAFGFAFATTSLGCEESQGCPPDEHSCIGNTVVTGIYSHDGAQCSMSEYFDDCWAGSHCSSGACVRDPPERPCPNGNGFCNGNEAFACVEGGLPQLGNDCSAQGLSCFEVPANGGHVQAVCALSDDPCHNMAVESQCEGNNRIRCADGYPVEVLAPCEGENVVCVDYAGGATGGVGAQCTYSVSCPADGGTICHDGVVHGCSGTDRTIRLRDCGSDLCVVRSGRALCSASDERTPPSRWLAIPGGTYLPGWDGEVAVSAFEMLEKEVSVTDYLDCVLAGACTDTLPDCNDAAIRFDLHADLPVACTDFSQAKNYCSFVGGRLPTDIEWLFAATNAGQDVEFPWGDEGSGCAYAACGFEPTPGCRMPDDVTTQGVCDLAGNLVEWVTMSADGAPAEMAPLRDGGGRWLELAARGIGLEFPSISKGFRCVR